MPQNPDWQRYLEAGMQFTELRRSQARAVAAELVGQGQLARDQVSGAVDEIMAMSRRRSEELQLLIRREVERQLGVLGIATKADIARLERKIKVARKATAKKAKKSAPAAKKKAAPTKAG
jgi:polyhydroxyalkanoate synthesis regulator phasin